MDTVHHSAETRRVADQAPAWPPLDKVTAPGVGTAQAAHYLDREPQTLRIWAMGKTKAPIKPLRLHGRLLWPVADLRRLLGVEVA